MLESRIAASAVKYRNYLFCLTLLLFGFMAAGLQYTQFDGSTRYFFGKEHPKLLAYEAVEAEYGRVETAMFMLSAKQGDLFTPQRLALLEQLSEKMWQVPHATRVESLTNYQYSYAEADDLSVVPLVEAAGEYSAADIALLKQRALAEPALLNRLLNPNGKHAAIVLTFVIDTADRLEQEADITAQLYRLVAQVEQDHPDLTVALSGNIVNDSEVMKTSINDLSLTIPIMYGLIFGLLALLLRSISAMIAIAFIAIGSCVAALGGASWAGITLSPVGLSSVSIVITVAIAHCVHVVVYFLQQYQDKSQKAEAIFESLRVNFQPMLVTSVTTAIGFLSLNFNKVQPAIDLGNISAIGVTMAFIASMTLLPALLMLLPIRIRKLDEKGMGNIDGFASFVINNRRALLVISLVLSALMMYLASNNIVNDRFTESMSPAYRIHHDTKAIDAHMMGLYTLEYSLPSGAEHGVSAVEYLEKLDAFTLWLRQQPEINSVFSYSDVIKRLNRNMHGDDVNYYKIPDNRELAAQYLLLYEMSLPYGQDLSNQVTTDKAATRVAVSLPSTDTYTMLDLYNRINAWQAQNLPASMRHDGASHAIMFTFLALEASVDSMQGAVLALLLISLILTFIMRSLRYGLISLIPNLMPAAFGFGIWYLYSGEINMNLMNVLCITIGIVVDDTVHFLSKYLRAKREQSADTIKAIRIAFHSVGPALWITTVILVAGFGSMTASGFVPTQEMGGLIAVIIASALVLDFFMLPPLLMYLDRKRS